VVARARREAPDVGDGELLRPRRSRPHRARRPRGRQRDRRGRARAHRAVGICRDSLSEDLKSWLDASRPRLGDSQAPLPPPPPSSWILPPCESLSSRRPSSSRSSRS
jgi:hypothetical protein